MSLQPTNTTQLNIEKMAAEVRELRALCEEAACPVVFCHNDLLPGNILVVQREGTDVNDRSKVSVPRVAMTV
jgi:thiamine kinase-like enzyme